MRKILPSVLLLLCFHVYLRAQTDHFQFSQLGISDGLSNNQVNCIHKDAQGFMWFGTMSGLNRYDGFEFTTFKTVTDDSTSINDDYIVNIYEGPDEKLWIETRSDFDIYNPLLESFEDPWAFFESANMPMYETIHNISKDSRGDFWFLLGKELYRYNPQNKNAESIETILAGKYISSLSVKAFCLTPDRYNAWIVFENGNIALVDVINGSTVYSTQITNNDLFGSQETALKAFADSEGSLWIYAMDGNLGIFHFRKGATDLRAFNLDSDPALNTAKVRGVAEDTEGRIWLSTDHGGVNIISKDRNHAEYLLHENYNSRSIAQNSINAIYKDSDGIIWLGTYKQGLSYYHPQILKFPLYQHQPSDDSSLPSNDVNCFVEDKEGNIWIGTNGNGLVYFNRNLETYTEYHHDPDNPESLAGNVVVSLCIDRNDDLWIGTYGAGLSKFDGDKFQSFKKEEGNEQSISDDRIYDILETSNGKIWLATLGGGVDVYDPEKDSFQHFSATGNLIHFDFVVALYEDMRGRIWVGTSDGIDVLGNKNGDLFKLHDFSTYNNSGLSNNNVICFTEDKSGTVWVGTRNGLNYFKEEEKSFGSFYERDGLPDNNIRGMVKSEEGLWVSTFKGLSRVFEDSGEMRFENFDEWDGLQGREFNTNACTGLRSGEVIFGGGNGFNLFDPKNIKSIAPGAPTVFTGFSLFNKKVGVNEAMDGDVVLEKSITRTNHIELNHDQNSFALNFSSLYFFDPQEIQYAYKLEGHDRNWVASGPDAHQATYTNLDPGDYTFYVRTTTSPQKAETVSDGLHIHIAPPFYNTTWAYVFYVILVGSVLFFIRYRGIQKLKSEFAIEQERKESQRIIELDRIKIKFFTNVSHEFRTPLSLIMLPAEKLLAKTTNQEDRRDLDLIKRNARRLLNLVNQLMDFRKMEVKELRLNLQEEDIIGFVRNASLSFTDLAEDKNIDFRFHSSFDSLHAWFDPEKLERILFNLLSNSFKFTPKNGKVSVHVDLLANYNRSREHFLEVKVSDTGIGIPESKQERIFENFFQDDTPAHMLNPGSGIGLSIVKEFVHLHNGEVLVESTEGKGSTFTVLLPLRVVEPELPEPAQVVSEISFPERKVQVASEKNQSIPSILLVEDNDDFRFYLQENLKGHFIVNTATNGKEGWQKVLSTHPAIVVSDILMPVMDGVELCKQIKNDHRTHHIPVLLLSARSEVEDQLEGLQIGAADYITKPFNFEILFSKLRNILRQQSELKTAYSKKVEAMPAQVEMDSEEEKFVSDSLRIMEENLGNADFTVEEMSREMNMSRASLYNKMITHTEKSPIEFIRDVRLKRARQLLAGSKLTIAEVAYEVGFNNPKYFTKIFKNAYGCLPSKFRKDQKS